MKTETGRTAIFLVVIVVVVVAFGLFVLSYTRRVSGISMLPTLEDGDLVVILPTQASAVHLGDIIVYGPPCSATGEDVIHRVIQASGGGFITKGDNNAYSDQAAGIAASPIFSDCIVGKVVFTVPYLERIASLPYGANYAIAALIIVVIVFIEFYPRRSEGEASQTGEVGTQPAAGGPTVTTTQQQVTLTSAR
ncbi:MAG TPA: signal peptidase I [Nitrososphaerales archaeon]|nr:signal peptidase I [Nitrososphaerales archaeon]